MQSENIQTRERLLWVDSLKGLLIICVVLGHVVDGYIESGLYIQAETALRMVKTAVYAFHMPAFFAVSGFMYRRAYVTDDGLRVKRVRGQAWNLLGVYVIFSVLMCAGKVAFSSFVNNTLSWGRLLRIWIEPIAPYWYLYVLLIYMAFMSIRCVRALPGGVVFAFLFAVSVASDERFIRPIGEFQTNLTLLYAVFFYTGYLYGREGKLSRAQSGVALAIGAAALLAQGVTLSKGEALSERPYMFAPFALAVVLFLLEVFRRVRVLGENPVLRRLGLNSMEIYVMHCFFTAAMRPVVVRLRIESAMAGVLVNFAVAMAAVFLIVKITRRTGIHDYLFKPYDAFKRLACGARKSGGTPS